VSLSHLLLGLNTKHETINGKRYATRKFIGKQPTKILAYAIKYDKSF